MEPIDIARLEEAVVVFYRSTSQEQAHLHEWLTKAQISTQAWQFSWQLMQLGKVNGFSFNRFINMYLVSLTIHRFIIIFSSEPRSTIFRSHNFAL